MLILQWKLIFFASPDQHRQLGFQALLQMFHRPSCSFECSCHSKVAVINIFNMIIMLAVSFFLEPCVHFSFRKKSRRSLNGKLQHMNNQMINFQAILWPADPMRRRRGEWTFQKFANKILHKNSLIQKYSPFFAFSPNQYLCHKVCLGECMYCRAYTPSPQKALKCHWRNEILLAQHIPYQQSNPTFDQEHQHILQECNNMWQIFPLSKHTVLICVHVWRQTEGWRRRC